MLLWKGSIERFRSLFPTCALWVLLIHHDILSSVLANCSFFSTIFRKTILILILKTVFLNYLFVLLFLILIRFSMNTCIAIFLSIDSQWSCEATFLQIVYDLLVGSRWPVHLSLWRLLLPFILFPSVCIFRYYSEVVGSNGLEPSTSRLSGARSNHLSYEPIVFAFRPFWSPC